MQQSSIIKKLNPTLTFIIIVGATIVLGFLAGVLSGATGGYTSYTRPALTPPDIVFSIVWPILYFMMGTSAFIALYNAKDKKTLYTFGALYVIQLALNLIWPFIFFTLDAFTFSAIVNCVLTGSVLALTILAFSINKVSGLMLIPYFLWLLFAIYLNISIAVLN
ncbi:MAG: tryptophan-rich sensory protein [Clostridiales bacterium]|nr:tryptophan-rich sensory protein [Clostridiales bacterium]